MPYDQENIFAKIIRGEVPCKKIYEDEYVLAFHDIAQAAPIHAIVVPKGDYLSFDDFAYDAGVVEVGEFFMKVRRIAHELGAEKGGYRILTNHGKFASQSVSHFHVHIIGGRPLGALLPGDNADR